VYVPKCQTISSTDTFVGIVTIVFSTVTKIRTHLLRQYVDVQPAPLQPLLLYLDTQGPSCSALILQIIRNKRRLYRLVNLSAYCIPSSYLFCSFEEVHVGFCSVLSCEFHSVMLGLIECNVSFGLFWVILNKN